MDVVARKERLISLFEALPEVALEAGGDRDEHLGASVRNKRFAWYLDDHHGDGVVAITCKAPPGVNSAMIESVGLNYFMPSYTGSRGWIGVRLDLEAVDWDTVEELLTDAYQMTAPKTLAARLDS